jgi:hypothetical protein
MNCWVRSLLQAVLKQSRERPVRGFTVYTEFVSKTITINLGQDAAGWARRKAAEENTSVSRLVGRMIEEQMRMSDDYRRAYARWNKMGSIPGLNASSRLSREEAHERK